MRVLVTAAGKYDSTGEIARAIGEVLRSRGFAATVARPEDVRRLDRYDAVVVGSSVYSGHWMRPARRFVSRATAALNRTPVWTFSAAVFDDKDPREDRGGLRARGHRRFARGRADYPWRDATTWANEIADQLSVSVAA